MGVFWLFSLEAKKTKPQMLLGCFFRSSFIEVEDEWWKNHVATFIISRHFSILTKQLFFSEKNQTATSYIPVPCKTSFGLFLFPIAFQEG